MRIVQSYLFRAFCAIAIGGLLIAYPDNTVIWITVAIGAMFFLSGVISCISYYLTVRQIDRLRLIGGSDAESVRKPFWPVLGAGSIILGALLAMTPEIFITGLMYILGAVLVLGAVNQFGTLIEARRTGFLPFAYWICPSAIFLTGVFVLVYPMDTASLPMLIIGWCSLLYGITEIINTLKIRSKSNALKQFRE